MGNVPERDANVEANRILRPRFPNNWEEERHDPDEDTDEEDTTLTMNVPTAGDNHDRVLIDAQVVEDSPKDVRISSAKDSLQIQLNKESWKIVEPNPRVETFAGTNGQIFYWHGTDGTFRVENTAKGKWPYVFRCRYESDKMSVNATVLCQSSKSRIFEDFRALLIGLP